MAVRLVFIVQLLLTIDSVASWSFQLSATSSSSEFSSPPATSFAIRWEDLTCSHDGGDTYQLREAGGVLPRRSRVALVGRNGAGKSTLLRILAAECGCLPEGSTSPLPPYTGRVELPKDVRVAFVEQDPPYPANVTVAEALLGGDGSTSTENRSNNDVYAVVRRYWRAAACAEQDPQAFAFASAAMDAAFGSWDVLTKADEVATQLRVHHLKDQLLQHLSGGERKRVALAAAIIREPQLLLLDEPTNFLSLAGVSWLADLLLQRQQKRSSSSSSMNDLTLLMVTHDRAFLDQICNRIIELDCGRLFEYDTSKNGYADYLQAKEQRSVIEHAARQSQKRIYKTELEWMRRQPQARQTKAQARIDAFRKLEQAVQPQPTEAATINLVAQQQGKNSRIGGKILSMRNVSLKFGKDKIILNDFSYDFCKGDRICLSGANGVGKTSFLRVLTGEFPPDSGTVEVGDTIILGIYDQLGLVIDDPTQTVLDFVLTRVQESAVSASATTATMDADEARSWLRQFEFPRQRWSQRVSSLSGGERRRLQLLAVLIRRPNFLVMDEPSVDLDIPTLQALEAYLQESFEGVLILVSHDRYFADKVTDHLFIFEGNGEIKDFAGSLSEYASTLVELENQRAGIGANNDDETRRSSNPADHKHDRDKRNEVRNATRRAIKDMGNLEKAIDKLKGTEVGLQQEIDASGDKGWSVLADLTEQLDRIRRDIDEKEMKWMELAQLVEEAEVEL